MIKLSSESKKDTCYEYHTRQLYVFLIFHVKLSRYEDHRWMPSHRELMVRVLIRNDKYLGDISLTNSCSRQNAELSIQDRSTWRHQHFDIKFRWGGHFQAMVI
jgi:hypothetical protein